MCRLCWRRGRAFLPVRRSTGGCRGDGEGPQSRRSWCGKMRRGPCKAASCGALSEPPAPCAQEDEDEVFVFGTDVPRLHRDWVRCMKGYIGLWQPLMVDSDCDDGDLERDRSEERLAQLKARMQKWGRAIRVCPTHPLPRG